MSQSANARRPEPLLPLYWAAAGALCGPFLASVPLAVVLGAAVLVVSGAASRLPVRSVAAGVLALVLSAWRVHTAGFPVLPADHVARRHGEALRLRGTVVTSEQRADGSLRIDAEARGVWRHGAWQRVQGRIRITLRRVSRSWPPGARFEGPVRVRRPRNFGNPGEWDYEGYLARRGIYVTGFWSTDTDWRRLPGGPGVVSRWRHWWRSRLRRAIESELTPSGAALMRALVLGESGVVSPEVRDMHARAGSAHVLAISGLHVGLAFGAAAGAARFVLSRSERLLLRGVLVPKASALAGAFAVALYAALASPGPATRRAVAMAAAAVAAVVSQRPRHWPAALAAAVLVVTAAEPGAPLEVSFQLSFAAVTGILLAARAVDRWWQAFAERRLLRLRAQERRWRWLRRAVLFQAITTAAFLATAPLTALWFNRVTPAGLVSGVVALPLVGFVPVACGLLAAVLAAISLSAAAFPLRVAGVSLSVAEGILSWLANLPGASFRTPTPTPVEMAAFWSTAASPLLPRGLRAAAAIGGIAVLAGSAVWSVHQRLHRDELRVTFLAVGQGDSTVLELPGGPVLVVDGGGVYPGFDAGRRLVAPYLWHRRIVRPTVLAVTHPEFDHYNGLGFLAAEMGAAEVWWNGEEGRGASYRLFRERVHTAGIPLRLMRRGDRVRFGSVEVHALHPARNLPVRGNDGSLVLQIRYAGRVILLPGDIERGGEGELIEVWGDALRADVLKAPHHGSRTSSSAPFLDAVRPRWVVVPAGYRNRFGMPHPEVLARYRARGAKVYRTDCEGAIVVRVDARGVIRVEPTRAASRDCGVSDEPAVVESRATGERSRLAGSEPAAADAEPSHPAGIVTTNGSAGTMASEDQQAAAPAGPCPADPGVRVGPGGSCPAYRRAASRKASRKPK